MVVFQYRHRHGTFSKGLPFRVPKKQQRLLRKKWPPTERRPCNIWSKGSKPWRTFAAEVVDSFTWNTKANHFFINGWKWWFPTIFYIYIYIYCEGLWRRGAFWARFEALFLEPAAHVTQTHQRLTTGLNVQSHVGSSGECCCCRCTASGGPLECLEGRAGGSETAIAASDSRGEESGL